MKYFYSVLVLLLALFLAAFIQQNGAQVQLRYFSWSTPHLPLSLYMILCFAAGYALAVVVGIASGFRFRFRATGAEKELRQVRSELDRLKKEVAARTEPPESGADLPEPSAKEPSSVQKRGTGVGDQTAEEVPAPDIDPEPQTVVIGAGGEEEK